mmetsp:Transcript_41477/g.125635  ORF Transcript_41477/g.125635 Transcript_41477/m.125635 type:complete len:267 (+) Transcript_41477:1846-2646(+)
MANYAPMGKLDDEAALSALPSEIASNAQVKSDIASYSVNPHGDGVVVCGSVGEVGSDVAIGDIDGFDIKTPHENGGWTVYDREIHRDHDKQKKNLWTHLSLNSPDQLRQRVAWALYQIVPIAITEGVDRETEVWANYYDSFVRNAFGNYRDVLREMSYSNLMGMWLSFEDNQAVQYALDRDGRALYPDENYAREIMQLFSIGLFELNMDGTKKIDSNGEPISTYTPEDITSYARAWTGFTKNIYRGNAEQQGNAGGQRIDPMRIDG